MYLLLCQVLQIDFRARISMSGELLLQLLFPLDLRLDVVLRFAPHGLTTHWSVSQLPLGSAQHMSQRIFSTTCSDMEEDHNYIEKSHAQYQQLVFAQPATVVPRIPTLSQCYLPLRKARQAESRVSPKGR